MPAATAEILLDRRMASIRVGQFKGFDYEVPDDPALHQAMRDFLRDLRSGRHPLNREPAAQLTVNGPTSITLIMDVAASISPLAHARQAFPLYLALLPRGTAAGFDQWCDQTRLREGLSAVLHLIAAKEPATIGIRILDPGCGLKTGAGAIA